MLKAAAAWMLDWRAQTHGSLHPPAPAGVGGSAGRWARCVARVAEMSSKRARARELSFCSLTFAALIAEPPVAFAVSLSAKWRASSCR